MAGGCLSAVGAGAVSVVVAGYEGAHPPAVHPSARGAVGVVPGWLARTKAAQCGAKWLVIRGRGQSDTNASRDVVRAYVYEPNKFM